MGPQFASLGVAEFFERFLRHSKGPLAGEPFRLEGWQRAFVDELYRRDGEGRRIYRLAILGIPRGNGKSPLAAGLGLYELLSRPDSPDVICAAAARDQARIVLNFARAFVETGELAEHVKVGRSELVHEAGRGSMRVISADGALQHGLSVSAVVLDELWAFSADRQAELVDALLTSLHKRRDSFALAITTAGHDRETVLGRLYEQAQTELALERPHECLTIGRDETNGVLFWWYGAAEGSDTDDERLWRLANPASWLDLRDLRRQRNSPAVSDGAFKRLHLNVWTAGEETWIPASVWAACRSDEGIPSDGAIYVGVDASWTQDATAVAWAHRLPDGRIVVRCRVWSAVAETAAHVHLAGGRIDFTAVEDFILRLAGDHQVREVVFDPAYFARSAELLADRGLVVASLDQRSRQMRDAYGQLYEAVNAGTLLHDGDRVLASHVSAAAASLDEYGAWKIRKAKQSRKIDGLVATVIAHSRAARASKAVAAPVIAYSW